VVLQERTFLVRDFRLWAGAKRLPTTHGFRLSIDGILRCLADADQIGDGDSPTPDAGAVNLQLE
jgi:hypothetical protein